MTLQESFARTWFLAESIAFAMLSCITVQQIPSFTSHVETQDLICV